MPAFINAETKFKMLCAGLKNYYEGFVASHSCTFLTSRDKSYLIEKNDCCAANSGADKFSLHAETADLKQYAHHEKIIFLSNNQQQ